MNTETITLNIHKRIAENLKNLPYEIHIEDDGAGPYLALYTPNTPNEDENYRCLSLFNETDSETLTALRWHFWNNSQNITLSSDLTSEATDEEVLTFLQQGLDQEQR